MIVSCNDLPDSDIADVADIGGGGHDDHDGVDKWQEGLLPAFEVLLHNAIDKCKNGNEDSHGGEGKSNSEASKAGVAIVEQPHPI